MVGSQLEEFVVTFHGHGHFTLLVMRLSLVANRGRHVNGGVPQAQAANLQGLRVDLKGLIVLAIEIVDASNIVQDGGHFLGVGPLVCAIYFQRFRKQGHGLFGIVGFVVKHEDRNAIETGGQGKRPHSLFAYHAERLAVGLDGFIVPSQPVVTVSEIVVHTDTAQGRLGMARIQRHAHQGQLEPPPGFSVLAPSHVGLADIVEQTRAPERLTERGGLLRRQCGIVEEHAFIVLLALEHVRVGVALRSCCCCRRDSSGGRSTVAPPSRKAASLGRCRGRNRLATCALLNIFIRSGNQNGGSRG